MKTLYLNGHDIETRLEDRRLLVTNRTTGETQRVALFDLRQVVCLGQPHLTMPLMHELMKQNISIIFLSSRGQWLNAIFPNVNGNAPRRLKQYQLTTSPTQSAALAKELIDAKIHNLRRVLQRLADTRHLNETPRHLNETSRHLLVMRTLNECRSQLENLETLDAIRGCEGAVSACYFQYIDDFLPETMPFVQRTRRPPRNPVNALLSWTYTIVSSEITNAIRLAELDPTLGFMHQTALDSSPSSFSCHRS